MAELIRSGEFVDPGEQLTAANLEADLPPSWLVITNKVLVGRDGSTRVTRATLRVDAWT
jgi:hypothetical protein